ncbi:MAG TPA: MmcQ/YjbR family DNA-binding protein [Kofleriaceae bacterium]|jgi:hypothetical protein
MGSHQHAWIITAAVDFDGWATAWYILVADMVMLDDVRRVAMSLPRTEEHLVRGRVKFRVGKIVYVAFSRDETILGFAFPKEWRAALIEAQPNKFQMPEPADVRYNWVCVRRDAIDQAEMRKLVTEAWRMVVPKGVAAAHLDASRSRR